jgi:hypothetical protein
MALACRMALQHDALLRDVQQAERHGKTPAKAAAN